MSLNLGPTLLQDDLLSRSLAELMTFAKTLSQIRSHSQAPGKYISLGGPLLNPLQHVCIVLLFCDCNTHIRSLGCLICFSVKVNMLKIKKWKKENREEMF